MTVNSAYSGCAFIQVPVYYVVIQFKTAVIAEFFAAIIMNVIFISYLFIVLFHKTVR